MLQTCVIFPRTVCLETRKIDPGEDGVVMSYDLRSHHRGNPVLTRSDCSIKGMALNPVEPNYFFLCGDNPFLSLYDYRKADAPAAE